MIRTVHAIDAKPDENGVYCITTAAWPKRDAFTRDREWLYHRMRTEAEERMRSYWSWVGPVVPSPYVKLDMRP